MFSLSDMMKRIFDAIQYDTGKCLTLFSHGLTGSHQYSGTNTSSFCCHHVFSFIADRGLELAISIFRKSRAEMNMPGFGLRPSILLVITNAMLSVVGTVIDTIFAQTPLSTKFQSIHCVKERKRSSLNLPRAIPDWLSQVPINNPYL